MAYGHGQDSHSGGNETHQALQAHQCAFRLCYLHLHLHLLARLAVMAHGTDFLEKLDAAADVDEVIAAIRESEKEYR